MSRKDRLLPDKIASDNMEFIKMFDGNVDDKDVMLAFGNYIINKYIKERGYTLEHAQELTLRYLQTEQCFESLSVIRAVTNWHYGGRQVYVFDDDFAELLSGQSKADLLISSDTLKQLPCDSFFVQRRYKDSEGFFFDLKDDTIIISEYFKNHKSNSIGLRFTADDTVEGIIDKMLVGRYDNVDVIAKPIAEKLQYIVYLSAINAEISPVTKRQARKSDKKVKKPQPLQIQKPAIAEVGYRIGAAVRKQKQIENVASYQRDPNAHGTPKSPHIRRAHFHRYKTKDGYVTKWTHTIFVNADRDVGDISTVHKVIH